MTDLLAYLVGEGKNYVMIFLWIIFVFILLLYIRIYRKSGGGYKSFENIFFAYEVCSIFACMYTVDVGFTIAELLINKSRLTAIYGWIALLLCIVYAGIILYILCNTIMVNKKYLYISRIFLLISPFLISLFYYNYVYIITEFNEKNNFQIILQKKSIEIFFLYSVLCFPWLLFFSFSSKFKNTWIELAQDRARKRDKKGSAMIDRVAS